MCHYNDISRVSILYPLRALIHGPKSVRQRTLNWYCCGDEPCVLHALKVEGKGRRGTMTTLRPGPSGVRILKSTDIEIVTFLKRAPWFSLRAWGRNKAAVTEEYCWAIKQAARGRGACCDRSGSSVLGFGFQLESLIRVYMYAYVFIHLVVCLTRGPKPLPKRALHIVRSRASSFKWEYPLLSLRSSNS